MRRLLVVDDDELSREVIAMLLEAAGYQVATAESGDAALDRLRNVPPADLPEAILTDMRMPGTTGAALAEALRNTCGEHVVLLAMSASEVREADRGGFQAILLKPFTVNAFETALLSAEVRGEAAATPAGTAVLDEAVYTRMRGMMGPNATAELYALCLSDARKRLATMRQAACDGDDAVYRAAAHAIKGSCGMVGALELKRLAGRMEQSRIGPAQGGASQPDLDEFSVAMERLQRILAARSD